MSRRVRTVRTSITQTVSTLKSKNKSVPIRKMTRSTIQKKSSVKNSSPTKRYMEQTSSPPIQQREKRLSSLTATALLQYCSSILSPSRKLNRSIKSTSNLSDNSKVNILFTKRKYNTVFDLDSAIIKKYKESCKKTSIF